MFCLVMLSHSESCWVFGWGWAGRVDIQQAVRLVSVSLPCCVSRPSLVDACQASPCTPCCVESVESFEPLEPILVVLQRDRPWPGRTSALSPHQGVYQMQQDRGQQDGQQDGPIAIAAMNFPNDCVTWCDMTVICIYASSYDIQL